VEHLRVRVYVIIVNWNGGSDTVECLESLFRSDYPRFTALVCDNGSSDDSLEMIKKWAGARGLQWRHCEAEESPGAAPGAEVPLVLLSSRRNLGFAGGNNLGIRYALAAAECDFVWLLNNDTTVEPDALSHLVRRMADSPRAGICGSTLRLYHRRDRVQAFGGGRYLPWIGLPWHYGRFRPSGGSIDAARAERSMNYVEGASMLVSRRFVEEVGPMCEDYFLYFEEADWSARGRGRFGLAYAPLSVVYHKVGASIGTSRNPLAKSYLSDYFNIRNRILFTRRFHPAALPTVYLVLLGALLLRLSLGQWGRAAMVARLMLGVRDERLEATCRGRSLS
jgi:GT2 family glycosyltransferase